MTNIHQVFAAAEVEAGLRRFVAAWCDPGERVISGGWSGQNIEVEANTATFDPGTARFGWAASFYNTRAIAIQVNVNAFCYRPTS